MIQIAVKPSDEPKKQMHELWDWCLENCRGRFLWHQRRYKDWRLMKGEPNFSGSRSYPDDLDECNKWLRQLVIEFDDPRDAMLFKLTFG